MLTRGIKDWWDAAFKAPSAVAVIGDLYKSGL